MYSPCRRPTDRSPRYRARSLRTFIEREFTTSFILAPSKGPIESNKVSKEIESEIGVGKRGRRVRRVKRVRRVCLGVSVTRSHSVASESPTRSSPCPLRDGTAAGMRCEHDGAMGIVQAGEWPHAKPSQPWRAAVGCGGGGGDDALALQARDVERSASGEHAASARGRRKGIAGNRG